MATIISSHAHSFTNLMAKMNQSVQLLGAFVLAFNGHAVSSILYLMATPILGLIGHTLFIYIMATIILSHAHSFTCLMATINQSV
jgi:hypothetical protein